MSIDDEYFNVCNQGLKELPDLSHRKDIKILNCAANKLTKLSRLPPNIVEIFCRDNQITDISNLTEYPMLERLHISNNPLEEIPSIHSLKVLVGNFCKIRKINDLNKVQKIYCHDNKISDLGNFPNLNILEISYNRLRNIPVYELLTELYCDNNKITKLEAIYPNISVVHCFNNRLDRLIYLGEQLTEIVCDSDKVTRISKHYDLKEAVKYERKNRLFLKMRQLSI